MASAGIEQIGIGKHLETSPRVSCVLELRLQGCKGVSQNEIRSRQRITGDHWYMTRSLLP